MQRSRPTSAPLIRFVAFGCVERSQPLIRFVAFVWFCQASYNQSTASKQATMVEHPPDSLHVDVNQLSLTSEAEAGRFLKHIAIAVDRGKLSKAQAQLVARWVKIHTEGDMRASTRLSVFDSDY